MMLDLGEAQNWRPPIERTIANKDQGVAEGLSARRVEDMAREKKKKKKETTDPKADAFLRSIDVYKRQVLC